MLFECYLCFSRVWVVSQLYKVLFVSVHINEQIHTESNVKCL